MSGEGREAAEPGSEVQGEAGEKITTGNIQGSSLEQKQPQPAAEPSATATSKCGGESTATAQKRQILPSIPQRDTGPCVYSSKKSMEEMEKALSDFSGSVPEAVSETQDLQGLQRAGFRRGSLHTALPPSSLQAFPPALLPLEAHRPRLGHRHNPAQGGFYVHLAGKGPALPAQLQNNESLQQKLGSQHSVIFISFLKY